MVTAQLGHLIEPCLCQSLHAQEGDRVIDLQLCLWEIILDISTHRIHCPDVLNGDFV